MKTPKSRKLTFATLVAVPLLSSSLFATLIPIGTVNTSGSGLGAVYSLVTFQNQGTESGAVGLSSTGAFAEGSAYTYFGGNLSPAPATGVATQNQTGSGNNIYTLASLGATNFSNIVLVFNGNEGGGPGQDITLDRLALNVYSTTNNSIVGSFATDVSPDAYASFPGTGVAGFAYQLNAAEAAQANSLITTYGAGNLRIGGAATASGANSGPETVFISTIAGATGVPDSGATVAMLGLALAALGAARRFLK